MVMAAYGGASGMRLQHVATLSLDAQSFPALHQAQAIRTATDGQSMRESVVHSVAIIDSESTTQLGVLAAMRSGQIVQLVVGLTSQPPVFELVGRL